MLKFDGEEFDVLPEEPIEDVNLIRSELEAIFLTPEKLFYEINELVWMEDISYIEATVRICDEKSIDFSDLTKYNLMSPNLFDEIRKEAMNNGSIPKESMLPI